MSTLLAHELDRSELLERVKILRTHGGRVMDVLRAGRGDKAAAERVEQWKNITRALADQTTTDNVGLLPASILGSPAVTASTPVLASPLASPMPPGKTTSIATWPTATATRNPAEKVAGTAATIDGSDVTALAMRVSALAVDVSFQVLDFGLGVDFDGWLESIVAADLETQLLADLATAGTVAADLPAALAACSPSTDYVVASMADTLTAAPTLAALRQAGVTNAPTVIVTPNTAATLVVSSAAVVIAAHPVQVGAELDVVLLCRSDGAWASGVAGTSVASAVQVVA